MATTTTTQTTSRPVGTIRITAENMREIFPEIDTSLAVSAAQSSELEGYDAEQVRLMDEVCIVLDEDDKPIGSASKKTCEFWQRSDIAEIGIAFNIGVFCRSLNGKYRPRASTSSIFCLPVRPRRSTAAAATRR